MAVAVRSDKLLLIQLQVTLMRANVKALLALLMLFFGLANTSSAAAPSVAAQTATPPSVETKTSPAAAENGDQTKALDAAQAPTLDDAALKAPRLGTALEAFQPSEAISADNAVPFPINI